MSQTHAERPAAHQRYVLDASVGVKFFKPESGQAAAMHLLQESAAGRTEIFAPAHFIHEVLAVVSRQYRPGDIVAAWDHLYASGVTVLPLMREVVQEAARQCELLGCSFYDALAPACAVLLDATLASADERAHGKFPGVHLVR